MHVARNDIQNDPKRAPRWEFVEQALPYFNMAIEALENLDRGNRVVERCVSYMSQLTLFPISASKLTHPSLQRHYWVKLRSINSTNQLF